MRLFPLVLMLLALAAVSNTAVGKDGGKKLSLTQASLEELQQAMRSGALSSVELSVLYLNRILAYDRRGPKLNAIPVLNPKWLQEAARADALRAHGIDLGPLHGIPVVLKDSYNVVGLPTSVGIAAWRGLEPAEDAFVVVRLRRAGAVIVGKANMDTFAASDDGVSQAFGFIRNPYGAARVGGSSGGSAVAVAAHLAAVSFGGDTAGSLRMPASRNHVVSLRPTLGLISTRGTAPGDPLFDVIGPFARSVRDLAIVLDVVVAQDPRNPLRDYLPPFEQQRPVSYSEHARAGSLRGVTFGVPKRLTSDQSAPPELLSPGKPILELFMSVRQELIRAGARIVDVDVPLDRILDDTWYYDQDVSQAGVEARAIYDARASLVNIRALAHQWAEFCRGWCGDPADRMLDVAALIDYPEFMQAFTALRDGVALELSSEPVRRALRSAMELADGALHAGWMAEQDIDALLFPASSDGDADTRFGLNYLSELGLPGLFVPAGLVRGQPAHAQQPVGVAIVGRRFGERQLLEWGASIESVLHARINPHSAPALADEDIALQGSFARPADRRDKRPPELAIDSVRRVARTHEVLVSGLVADIAAADLRVYVNGAKVQATRQGRHWTARISSDDPDVTVVALARDTQANVSAAVSHLVLPIIAEE